jgi:predicted aldo/keto reductase-like oxidoreductase
MKYRTFGKTGLEVSALGFGCMRLPVVDGVHAKIDEPRTTAMLRQAIDRGVNYLDTAYVYHSESFAKPGNSEPFLARALKDGYRDKVYLATKQPSWLVQSPADMDRFLDEQLERLETETIEFYLLHSMNRGTWDRLVKNRVSDFLDRALASGKICYAGFSFHDELPLFREIVDAYDWDFCQIMYNYYDVESQAGREGLHYAAEKGLGVVVMEPLRGGALIRGLPEEARKVFREADAERTEAEWAFRWVWDHPEVSTVLSGMNAEAQVEENLRLAETVSDKGCNGEDRNTLGKVSGIIRRLQRVDCTACGYCLPCPEGVNIPRNFSLINDHHMLSDPSAKTRYFGFLGEKERASACVECGQCEEQCPQQIPIIAELTHVVETFES